MADENGEKRLTRRRTLSLSASALAVVLAGCTDIGLGGEGGEEGNGGGEDGDGGGGGGEDGGGGGGEDGEGGEGGGDEQEGGGGGGDEDDGGY